MDYVSIFIQELLKQLLPWLVSLLVAVIVKVVGDFWLEYKLSKPDKAEVLEKVARMAVYAAEQAQLNQMISDKKTYALELAQRFLRENYRLNLNLTEIDQAIEAEVGKMNVGLMGLPFYPPDGFPGTVETR